MLSLLFFFTPKRRAIASYLKASMLSRAAGHSAALFPGPISYRFRRALMSYHVGGFYVALRLASVSRRWKLPRRIVRKTLVRSIVLLTFGLDELMHVMLRAAFDQRQELVGNSPSAKGWWGSSAEIDDATDNTDNASSVSLGDNGSNATDDESGAGEKRAENGGHIYECPICQEESTADADGSPMLNYCLDVKTHVAHEECMRSWFYAGQPGSRNCPVCRAALRFYVSTSTQDRWMRTVRVRACGYKV